MTVAWELPTASPKADSFALQYSVDGGEIWKTGGGKMGVVGGDEQGSQSHSVDNLPPCKLIFWRIFGRNKNGPGGVSKTLTSTTQSDGKGVTISGRVSGDFSYYVDVSMGDTVGDKILKTTRVRNGGVFTFKQVPAGEYFLKVEKPNWKFPKAKGIIVYEDQAKHSCLSKVSNQF